MAIRPDYGTLGRSVNIFTNHYELKCNLQTIYHFDVVIKRIIEKKCGEINVYECHYLILMILRI